MTTPLRLMVLAAALIGCAAKARAAGVADLGGLATERKFQAPELEQVRQKVLDWLAQRESDPAKQRAAEALWSGPSRWLDVLERLAQTFALVDERAASLVALSAKPRSPGPLAPQEWLKSEELSPFERTNLRLFYGRWLAQERYYDEALAQLNGLDAAQVVDPASLFFYQAVVHHRLLHKDDGLKALHELLDNVDRVPSRYRSVAALMKNDLEALKDESLDHISRQMEDVRRRLALGRTGKKVREVEDDVIAGLDKLIKEMEDRRQQQQSQNSSGGGLAPQPSQPMQQSRIAQLKGPGEVDRRRLGDTSGWGNLPPKQREEALQQIGKDFPPHYRDAIEQYFRKLAAEAEDQPSR